MVIFLGSWGALKIPQLIVEMKFLGTSLHHPSLHPDASSTDSHGMLMEYLLLNNPEKASLKNNHEGEAREDKDKH